MLPPKKKKIINSKLGINNCQSTQVIKSLFHLSKKDPSFFSFDKRNWRLANAINFMVGFLKMMSVKTTACQMLMLNFHELMNNMFMAQKKNKKILTKTDNC